MPTSGIRIVNEANLHSYYPTTAVLGGKGDILVEEINVPVTLNQNNILLENIEPAGKTFVNLDTKSHWGGGYSTIVTTAPATLTAEMPVFAEIQSNNQVQAGQLGGRRGGGRRSAIKMEELSPEEEERVRVRRERNKLAAARCRKRRVDQTESLQSQVDEEEEKKRLLQEEIHALQSQKEELQFILQAHKEVCNRTPPSILPNSSSPAYHTTTNSLAVDSPPVASRSLPLYAPPLPPSTTTLATRSVALNVPKVIVKSEVPDMEHYQVLLTHEQAANLESNKPSSPKRARPATLSLAIKPQCLRSIEGIPIETPTNVFSSLNFDALMDGRTGLTPTNVLTPVSITMSSSSLQTPVVQGSTPNTCATQQQRSNHATTSPDSHKLVAL